MKPLIELLMHADRNGWTLIFSGSSSAVFAALAFAAVRAVTVAWRERREAGHDANA